MALRSVSRSTLAEQVARQLEGMIVRGEWVEGTTIPPEPALMEQLGVSRNTLREAIRALTVLGVLEARPGAGTFVRSTSLLGASVARRLAACTLDQTLEARECLERSAARLAAQRRDDRDVRELRQGLEAIERAVAAGDTTEALTDLAFAQERRLLEASRNPILIELLDSIAGTVRAAIATTISRLRDRDDVAAQACSLGRRLVERIEAGDPEGAADVISEKSRLARHWVSRSGPSEEGTSHDA